MKKICSVLLSVSLFICSMFAFSSTASANQSRYYNFSTNYTLTGNAVNDMIAIGRAQIGKTGGQLGYTEWWCDNFVSDCAILAGQASAIPQGSTVLDFYNQVIRAGGYEVQSPQAGDVVVFLSGSSYMHAAFMSSSTYSIHGNLDDKVGEYSVSDVCRWNGGWWVKYIRPKYTSSISFSDNKNVVRTGETISFFYDGLRDASYVEICFEKDGNVYFTDNTTKSKEYTTYFVNEGIYYVFVKAQINGYWVSSQKLRVDVTNPSFNTDKTQVLTNEKILFSYDHLTNASKVELCFQKEGTVYFRQDVTKSKTTINYFEDPGEYEVFISASYCGTIITSDLIKIYVKNNQEICLHTNTANVNAVPSTCITPGHTAYTICKDCDKIIEGSNEELPLAEHTGDIATCKKKAICEICGVEYGEYGAHNETEIRNAKGVTCCEDGYTGDIYCIDCGEKISSGATIQHTGKHTDADGKWETNDKQHWHTCYHGTTFDEAEHLGGTATCKQKAICEVCGVKYGDYAKHKLTKHEKVEPTVDNDGSNEYWTCNECDKYFNDADGKCEIAEDDIVIGKLTIKKLTYLDGEVLIEVPSNAVPVDFEITVDKIVPPPAEIVEKVKDAYGESSEVLAYYKIRLFDENGDRIYKLDSEITIKSILPEKYRTGYIIKISQEDDDGNLVEMEFWREGEYICYKTDWLEKY